MQVNALQECINEAKARAEDFNAREKVFGFPPTEYPILTKIEEDLQVRVMLPSSRSCYKS
jgi:dynein heavy chain